jgi:hypothetical protein
MGYSPTKVNPEKFNSLGTTYSFVTYSSQLIKEFSLPDGKYYLKSLLFTQISGYTPNESDYTNPSLYLFNSDNKWTGIYLRAKILDKDNKPIKFDLTPEKQILDLIASKLLNIKPSNSQSKLNFPSNSSSSSSASCSVQPQADTQSIKSNHSAHNLCFNGTDLKITSSCLIFENRPSNLPAKSQQEALKHKQEYEKMVEIAKKKGKK